MNEVCLTLAIKSTVILTSAVAASFVLRHQSAAVRHLNWLIAVVALLVLPLGPVIPPTLTVAVPDLRIAVRATTQNVVPRFPWLSAIWLAGILVLMLRLAISLVAVNATRRRVRAISSDGDITVGVTDLDLGPVACGLGRRLILLPESAQAWTEERRRAVLLHESAHLRRGDCWALLAAEIATAIYWFHPLVWYAARAIRREQEHAADDHVLRSGVFPSHYAHELIQIARDKRAPALMAGAVTRSDLAARIKAILDSDRRRTMLTRRMLLAGLVAVLAVAIPLTAMQAQRKVYKIADEGVTPPRLVVKHEPQYTEYAKNEKIEGTVLLSVLIDEDGLARDIDVVKSLEKGLDANAIAAVESWQFKPAQKDGKPVAVSARIEVNFRLK